MKPARFMFPMFALTTIDSYGEYRLLSLHDSDESALVGGVEALVAGRSIPHHQSFLVVPIPAGTSVDELERVIEACARLRASGVGKVGA